MFKINRKTIFVFFLFVIFCIACYQLLLHYFETHLTPYTDQHFFAETGIIVVKNSQYENTEKSPKMTIYRLRDKAPQDITDDMNLLFVNKNEAAFVPKELTSTSLMFLVDERFAQSLLIRSLPGPIFSIRDNPSSTYILVQGIRSSDSSPYFCLGEKNPEKIPPALHCNFIVKNIFPEDSPFDFSISWDKKEEKNLIIYNKKTNKLYLYDPWEKIPVEVVDQNLFTLKKHYLDSTQNPKNHSPKISKWGPILISKDQGHFFWKFVPFFSHVILVDENHIIVQYGREVYLIDQSLTHTSFFVTLKNKNDEIFSYYTVN
ncbi:MAG: hypothetical protein COV59_01825 [Candidatus Magasanikbacteria bacterium CG11_big_fil_rev_8_21_14_0_20_39_34]|uniref:Uncharacterized protein n=1 Tax=Candidatus Magasanikbacteria bacterium CG11_big_fil_rev_8_21_14_0_20_39_34 TaxID=1974653 RepID=A0A2H0N709_9BACT|nr:MAG: hypothetical protein COV59_01825 [Candidatus Magasanikbacteria bacterium CG11_big_fil_rev_8_21_14_0_20_39_34]